MVLKAIEIFVNYISDFNSYEKLFLCRDKDLDFTPLKRNIKMLCPKAQIVGISPNCYGPLFSLTNIFNEIQDDQKLCITYIDNIQKLSLNQLELNFTDSDGGVLVHGLSHPHWRTNQYYCLVKHNDALDCEEVIEKFNFSNLSFDDSKNCSGSNGTYYIKNGALFKKYARKILGEKNSINGEYYVTQIFHEMIKDGLKVKAWYVPYVSFGIPDDVNDFIFWSNWFK